MAKKIHRSYLLPAAACLIVMFCIGIVYLWSLFQMPVINYYGWAPESVTMIPAFMIFLFIFGTMVGGFIQDKKSPRFVILTGGLLFFAGLFASSVLGRQLPVWPMYITYGALAGCGVGFVYTGSLNCIQKWFPHRRGFASGLSLCAFGLSALALTPLIEWLLDLFGDNAVPLTFRTLAIVLTAAIVLAGLFIKNPDEAYLRGLNLPGRHTNQKQYTPGEVVKTAPFWCLSLTIFFLPAAFFIINPLFKSLAEAREIPEYMAVLAISLTGIAQAASRLISGVVSDKIGRARTVIILAAIMMLSAVLMTFAGGWLYVASVLLISFAYGGPSSVYPAMSTDAYGTKHSGGNFGMALMFMGVASPIFTMLSNWLNADGFETGDYTVSFIVAACVCVIPFAAMVLFDITKKRMKSAETGASEE